MTGLLLKLPNVFQVEHSNLLIILEESFGEQYMTIPISYKSMV